MSIFTPKRFFIRRKVKILPPLTPESLIPRNEVEASFIEAIRKKHMERNGSQPEDFIAYFVPFRIKGSKEPCRAVGIRKLKAKD